MVKLLLFHPYIRSNTPVPLQQRIHYRKQTTNYIDVVMINYEFTRGIAGKNLNNILASAHNYNLF